MVTLHRHTQGSYFPSNPSSVRSSVLREEKPNCIQSCWRKKEIKSQVWLLQHFLWCSCWSVLHVSQQDAWQDGGLSLREATSPDVSLRPRSLLGQSAAGATPPLVSGTIMRKGKQPVQQVVLLIVLRLLMHLFWCGHLLICCVSCVFCVILQTIPLTI